ALDLRLIEEERDAEPVEALRLAVRGEFFDEGTDDVLVELEEIANGVGVLIAIEPPHRDASAGVFGREFDVAQLPLDPAGEGRRFLDIRTRPGLWRHLAGVDAVDDFLPVLRHPGGREIAGELIDAEAGVGLLFAVAFEAMLRDERLGDVAKAWRW